MAVREFDGVDDDIIAAAGGLSGMQYGTVAVIIKVTATSDFHGFFTLAEGGASSDGVIVNNDDEWEWFENLSNFARPAATITQDVWYLLVARKPTGTVVPRFSVYNFTADSWTHGDGNGTVPDWSFSTAWDAIGFARAGTGSTPEIRAAIRAAWSNELGPGDAWTADEDGDAAIVAADLQTAYQNCIDQNPSAAWRFNQDSTSTAVVDDTGNGADETSLTGTNVVTGDDPPGFDFSLSSGTPIGRVTETGTARAFTASKAAELGRVTEADAVRTLPAGKNRELGRVTEVGTTRGFTASKAVTLGRVTETGTPRSLAGSKARALGRVTGTGTARALTPAKAKQVGRITDSGTVRSFTLQDVTAIGRVTGSATVRTLGTAKTKALGRVTETGTVRVLNVSGVADPNPIKLSFTEPAKHVIHAESAHVSKRERSRHVTFQEG